MSDTPVPLNTTDDTPVDTPKRGRPRTLTDEQRRVNLVESRRKYADKQRDHQARWKVEASTVQQDLVKQLSKQIITEQHIIDKMYELYHLLDWS